MLGFLSRGCRGFMIGLWDYCEKKLKRLAERRFHMAARRGLATLVLALLASGCGEEIVHDLAEAEANRVLSRLSLEAIEAEKSVQPDGRWTISVAKRHAPLALRLLDTRRVIPSRAQDAASFAKSGIVPSREEQWFRYERALAAVLDDTLQSMTGVLEAHVHLHLPQADPLFGQKAETGGGSSAVLLLVDEHFTVPHDEVAALVGGAAGISPNRVAVLKTVAAPRGTESSLALSQRATEDSSMKKEAESAPVSAHVAATAQSLVLFWEYPIVLLGSFGVIAMVARIGRSVRGGTVALGHPALDRAALDHEV